jgi:hypothetical protein
LILVNINWTEKIFFRIGLDFLYSLWVIDVVGPIDTVEEGKGKWECKATCFINGRGGNQWFDLPWFGDTVVLCPRLELTTGHSVENGGNFSPSQPLDL